MSTKRGVASPLSLSAVDWRKPVPTESMSQFVGSIAFLKVHGEKEQETSLPEEVVACPNLLPSDPSLL